MDSSAVPKVSVIIPLYNKAPYINRALDSVFAQTVQDFEIVVVGGNSTDGGEDIVHGYSDPRIRFVKEAGKGVSAARNQGVDAARAELVAFLDADDEWLPEFLETILKMREKWPEAGIYGTKYLSVTDERKRDTLVIPETPDIDFHVTNYFKEINEHGMLFQTSSMVIPKNIFHEVGGFPNLVAQNEDRYLRGRIALQHYIVCSPRTLMIYQYDINTYRERAKTYLSGAFAEYISQNMLLVSEREDLRDIVHFCDLEKLSISRLNLLYNTNRNTKLIRENILEITTPKLGLRKKILLIQSYLPQRLYLSGRAFLKYCMMMIRPIYRRILREHIV